MACRDEHNSRPVDRFFSRSAIKNEMRAKRNPAGDAEEVDNFQQGYKNPLGSGLIVENFGNLRHIRN